MFDPSPLVPHPEGSSPVQLARDLCHAALLCLLAAGAAICTHAALHQAETGLALAAGTLALCQLSSALLLLLLRREG